MEGPPGRLDEGKAGPALAKVAEAQRRVEQQQVHLRGYHPPLSPPLTSRAVRTRTLLRPPGLTCFAGTTLWRSEPVLRPL